MISIIASLFLLAAGPEARQPQVEVRGVRFAVDLAVTESEWQKGLMFRERLGKREGMLFVGKRLQPLSFWMKNTLVPLDIIFIGKDLKIITIHHKTTPLSEVPLPSARPALHVLEILGGEAKAAGLKEGDKVKILNVSGL